MPSWAGDTIQVGRWSNEKNGYVYTTAKPQAKKIQQGKIVAFANNPWGVVFPHAASALVLDHVDCFGNASEFDDPAENCMGWVATRGELRVRATVRYGWFDGFNANEQNKPALEVFVHRDNRATLPRMTGWTPGWISEFTVRNEQFVLAQLFDSAQLKQVTDKKRLFIEVDSNLLLNDIDFGNECGIRYQAKVLSAVPWKDAKVVAKSKGWEPHC